jgi:hypothetical protein
MYKVWKPLYLHKTFKFIFLITFHHLSVLQSFYILYSKLHISQVCREHQKVENQWCIHWDRESVKFLMSFLIDVDEGGHRHT